MYDFSFIVCQDDVKDGNRNLNRTFVPKQGYDADQGFE